jgi:hypothetical protein
VPSDKCRVTEKIANLLSENLITYAAYSGLSQASDDVQNEQRAMVTSKNTIIF